jgi:hypothetical protein
MWTCNLWTVTFIVPSHQSYSSNVIHSVFCSVPSSTLYHDVSGPQPWTIGRQLLLRLWLWHGNQFLSVEYHAYLSLWICVRSLVGWEPVIWVANPHLSKCVNSGMCEFHYGNTVCGAESLLKCWYMGDVCCSSGIPHILFHLFISF